MKYTKMDWILIVYNNLCEGKVLYNKFNLKTIKIKIKKLKEKSVFDDFEASRAQKYNSWVNLCKKIL